MTGSPSPRYNPAMAIILSEPLSIQELRVLQEFRRLAAETLSLATIKAIKHPAGGGEAPAHTLAGKGYLTADEQGQNFTLTEKAKELLAVEPKPLAPAASTPETAASEEPSGLP